MMDLHLVFSLLLCSIGSNVAHNHFMQPIVTRDPLVSTRLYVKRLINNYELSKEVDISKITAYKEDLILGKVGQHFKENVTACAQSIVKFGEDLVQKKQYSIQMIDSWGKLHSGVKTGDIRWNGRYFECLKSSSHDFDGKWCIMIVGQQAFASLQVGTCLPDTCSQEDTTDLFHPISNVLKAPVSAYCPIQPTKYLAADIVALIICSLLAALVIAGTVYDVYSQRHKKNLYERVMDESENTLNEQLEKRSVPLELLLSFSIIKSTRMIFDTSQKEGNINVLHGLRFFSMTWVILGHTVIFCVQFIENPLNLAEWGVEYPSFMAIENATYSVDTFFFLSGLLVTYLGMRQLERRSGKINILFLYLYRYLRLTPAYALCILVTTGILGKMGDGPLWPAVFEGTSAAPCRKYWWTNLLYINNVHPASLEAECFPHGWYLANDTQFFLLSPFILLLLYKSTKLGIFTLAFGIVSCIATTFALSFHYKEQPAGMSYATLSKALFEYFGFNPSKHQDLHLGNSSVSSLLRMSEADILGSDIYAKPWCRIASYLVGMGTGYYLSVTRCQIRMNKLFAAVMWLISSVCGLLIVYGLWKYVHHMEPLPNGLSAFYNAVTRPAWCLCLAWVVIACVAGYGEPVNTFLSWKALIPLSRLTYCAYLIHPSVLYWTFGTQEDLLHFSMGLISALYCGFVVLSYLVAYVISISIEMPVITIMKVLFPSPESTAKPDPERSLVVSQPGETEA